MAVKKPENLTFEAAVEELETIVGRLEQGDQSLEEALKQFERGILLVRAGQQKLDQAEQKVQLLLGEGENEHLAPFHDDEGEL